MIAVFKLPSIPFFPVCLLSSPLQPIPVSLPPPSPTRAVSCQVRALEASLEEQRRMADLTKREARALAEHNCALQACQLLSLPPIPPFRTLWRDLLPSPPLPSLPLPPLPPPPPPLLPLPPLTLCLICRYPRVCRSAWSKRMRSTEEHSRRRKICSKSHRLTARLSHCSRTTHALHYPPPQREALPHPPTDLHPNPAYAYTRLSPYPLTQSRALSLTLCAAPPPTSLPLPLLSSLPTYQICGRPRIDCYCCDIRCTALVACVVPQPQLQPPSFLSKPTLQEPYQA